MAKANARKKMKKGMRNAQEMCCALSELKLRGPKKAQGPHQAVATQSRDATEPN